MQNYNWQLDNFALGMHTEPAKTQGGERYAAEIGNLRIDSDGWLQLRSDAIALNPLGYAITGIATTPKHAFVLRSTTIPAGVSVEYALSLQDATEVIRATRTFEIDITLGGIGVDIDEVGVFPTFFWIGRETDPDVWGNLVDGTEIEIQQGENIVQLRTTSRQSIDTALATYNAELISGEISNLLDGADTTVRITSSSYTDNYWHADKLDTDTAIRFGTGDPVSWRSGQPLDTASGLFVRERDDLDTETHIAGVADLDGRISVVDFNTYVIITSEGEDQGYWIDVREDDNIVAYPLGFDLPGPSSITVDAVTEVPDGVDTELTTSARYIRYTPGVVIGGRGTVVRKLTPAGLTPNRFYHYRWTYAYLADPEDPWYGQESNPSLEADVEEDETQRGILETDAGVAGHSFILFTLGEEASATFGKITIAYQKYPLASHVRIYRSNSFTDPLATTEPTFPLAGDRRDNILENLTYRLIAEVDISDTVGGSGSFIFYDALHDGAEDSQALSWSDAEMMRTDNDRIPAEVKSIHRYNDLVFAPVSDRLIYSDIRSGSLVPWAYPAVNEIRIGEQITFCAELREVLLFGGRGRLSRLTGTDEYNFNIDTLSHRGPLDGYSWNRLTEVLAYIGEGGFFVTDASSVKPLSDPVLNRIFKDKKLLTGSVVFLQDGDILYDFKTPDGRYQYKLEDGAWARWTGIDIVQAAMIIEKVSDVDQATLVLLADGTGQLKELNWNSTEGADDADWHWESNIISGLSEGVANKFKRFRELEWTGQADGDVTLEVFNADAADTALSTIEFDSRDSLRPVRIPINRRMRRMIFRVSGTGTVKLQGLRLEMQV